MTFDCRSNDIKSYAEAILEKRMERFSTVYACCFVTSAEVAGAGGDVRPDGRQSSDMVLSASSTGELRLYRLADMVQRWTAGQQSGEASCSWGAHQGAVYCLAKAHTGSETVLLSGGDDGYVRGWRLSDILRQLQQQAVGGGGGGAGAGTQPARLSLAPCLEVRLPRAESALAAISLPPAVQALSLAQDGAAGATLFVGCSDGGVHAVDLATGSVAQPHLPGASGHAAAVLSMDLHGPSSCLATGSEDGTIRLWDTRGGAGAGCSLVRVLDAAGGREVAPGAEALRCLRGPHVSCLRFEPSGSWLLCGQGGAGRGGGGGGGSLAMWSLGMVQRARQVATSFVPQAMTAQPADLLVVGSEPALTRYSIALEAPTRQPLAARSAFGLDVHPVSGAVAVGGAGASLEVLSKYGKKTAGVYFVSDED